MDTPTPQAAVSGPSISHVPLPATSTSHAVNGRCLETTNGDREHETKDVLAEEQVIVDAKGDELYFRTYRSEAEDMEGIARLVDQELSEPYVLASYVVHCA